MKRRKSICFLAIFFAVCLVAMRAEAQTAAYERATRLREQLVGVLDNQEELQNRLLQLEEELKAENIEKSLAGVGSTRPEDLRELRRRQLETERLSVQNQLKQLAETRTRLEAAIVQADAAAYQQSAAANPEKGRLSGSQQQTDSGQAAQRPRRTRQKQNRPRARRIRRPTQE